MQEPEVRGAVEANEEDLPRILWADDDVQMREYVKALLRDRYVVETVTDGLAALESARSRLPDLLLADVMMPRLDGVSLVSALRADPATREVPAVLVSGRGGEKLKLQAFEAGADDFLLKPFSARELLARIKSHLELVAMRRASAAREAKLRAQIEFALEAGGLGYWQLDLETGAISCSDRCKSIYGLSPDGELDDMKLSSAIHPEDREAAYRALRKSVAERSDYEAEYRIVRPDGAQAWLLVRGRPAYSPKGAPLSVSGIVLDVTERKRIEARQRLLLEELNHRVNTTLATVNSIASRTLRPGNTSEEQLKLFEARLHTLSQVHTLLTHEDWNGEIARVIQLVLPSYATAKKQRFFVGGPDIRLNARTSLALALTFHELCVNAAKHGALSNEGGVVLIHWQLQESEGPHRVRLVWRERGGPLVIPPYEEGYGMAIIRHALVQDLGAQVEIDYDPQGLVCVINLPPVADTTFS